MIFELKLCTEQQPVTDVTLNQRIKNKKLEQFDHTNSSTAGLNAYGGKTNNVGFWQPKGDGGVSVVSRMILHGSEGVDLSKGSLYSSYTLVHGVTMNFARLQMRGRASQ